jgi:hypothetical protein
MGYDGMLGISTQLKTAYSRIIHPFDTFVAQVRGTSLSNSPSVQKYATRSSASSPLRTARVGTSTSTMSNSTSRNINGHTNTNGNSPAVNGNAKHRSLSPTRSSSESSLSTRDETEDSKEAGGSTHTMTPNKPSTPLPSTSKSGKYYSTICPYLLLISMP